MSSSPAPGALPLSTLLLATLIPSLILLTLLLILLRVHFNLRRQTKERRLSAPFHFVSTATAPQSSTTEARRRSAPTGDKAREAAAEGSLASRWSAEGERGASFDDGVPRGGGSPSEVGLSEVSGGSGERLSGEYVEARLVQFRRASSETMRLRTNSDPQPLSTSSSPSSSSESYRPLPPTPVHAPLKIDVRSRTSNEEEDRPPRPGAPAPRVSPPRLLRTRPSLSPSTTSPTTLNTIYELPPLCVSGPNTPTASSVLSHSLQSSRSSLSLRSASVGGGGGGEGGRRGSSESARSSGAGTEETLGPSEYWTAPPASSYAASSVTSASGGVPFPSSSTFNPMNSPTLSRGTRPPQLVSPDSSPRSSIALAPSLPTQTRPHTPPATALLSPQLKFNLSQAPRPHTAPELSSAEQFYARPLAEKLPVTVTTPPTTVLVRERSDSGERQLWRISASNLQQMRWFNSGVGGGGGVLGMEERVRPGSV